jgi:plastocyanin
MTPVRARWILASVVMVAGCGAGTPATPGTAPSQGTPADETRDAPPAVTSGTGGAPGVRADAAGPDGAADTQRTAAPPDARPGSPPDAAAVADAAPATDGVHRVTVENYQSMPLTLTIRAGESIEWVSNPAVAQPGIHLPTSATATFMPDGAWKAPDLIGPGHLKRFLHRFDEPGTFHVMCTTNASHFGQRGEHQTITVVP